MPGATFKGETSYCGRHLNDSFDFPFQDVKRSVENGNPVPSMTTRCLDKLSKNTNDTEKDTVTKALHDTAGTASIGGYETTSASVTNFIYLMANHPEAQMKAQEELDSVVGRERLPDFSDQENLLYTNALVKEVLRWFPVAPLAIPHRVTVDDEYKGMRIPEGRVAFPNIW